MTQGSLSACSQRQAQATDRARWPVRAWRWIDRNLIAPAIQPVPAERVHLNRKRWLGLPPHLQVPQQAAGGVVNSCGGTHGVMDACNLSCTACYLAEGSATARPLPEAEVLRQLDELRTMLGPQGKCQITAGEVTLLPEATLGRYVAYAIGIGLDPMLMTNGQKLLEDPDLLPRLSEHHDLQKLAIHVDITQRGRSGAEHAEREADLAPLRDRFAALIRRTRRLTGKPLHAAHTVTVSRDNLPELPQIMAWILDNVDAFRMVSFQPVASVGRTTEEPCTEVGMDAIWERICDGLGRKLNRHAVYFGHPECTILSCLLVVKSGSRQEVFELAEEGKRWDRRFFNRFLRTFGGLSTTRAPWPKRAAAVLSNSLRHPLFILEAPFYCAWRAWRARRELVPILGRALIFRGLRVKPLAVVVHRFMNEDEMKTDLGRERLSCCVFQVSLDGDPTSMCEMNAGNKRALWYGIQNRVEKTPSDGPSPH